MRREIKALIATAKKFGPRKPSRKPRDSRWLQSLKKERQELQTRRNAEYRALQNTAFWIAFVNSQSVPAKGSRCDSLEEIESDDPRD